MFCMEALLFYASILVDVLQALSTMGRLPNSAE